MAVKEAGQSAQRRRHKSLSSSNRETFARFNAIKLQYAFARANLVRLVGVGLAAIALTPFAWFLKGEMRGFILGAYLSLVSAVMLHWVIVASGSATLMMGDQGEQWTRAEVRSLKKSGWRTIHNALLKTRDIDTLLIGPAGVAVIETKWSGAEWTTTYAQSLVRNAAFDVRSSARDVQLFIQSKSKKAAALVHPIVVLWGPHTVDSLPEIEGVTLLDGDRLRSWLDELPSAGLAQADIDIVADHLAANTHKRDAFELAKRGPRPLTPAEVFSAALQLLYGALAGLVLTSSAASIVSFPAAFLPMSGAAAFAFFLQRLPWLKYATRAAYLASATWLVGVCGVFLTLTVWERLT